MIAGIIGASVSEEGPVSKTFRPYEPDQIFLMPAQIREWLPSDHLAYFVSDVVEQLDLSAVTERYAHEERGYPPYHSQMMVKVLLYAYCIGVPSSRKIARKLEEDIAFRVLAANNTPDFRTISDFRKDHLKALAGLFVQVLKLCQKEGLVKLGHVALDGTKIQANASKHKAMSYKRMKEEEARLEAEVAELHRKAETVDAEEDQRHGKGKRSDEWRLICAGHNLLKLCKSYRQGIVKPGLPTDITGVELSVATMSHPFRSQYQSPQFLLNTSCGFAG